jgi:hypothetical protein
MHCNSLYFHHPNFLYFKTPFFSPAHLFSFSKTLDSSMSYLHPSQKGTAQIGSSNHTNTYHVGVLAGNWMEERNSFGPQPKRDFKFTAKSETTERYPPRNPKDYAAAKPPQCVQPEAPRALIFGEVTGAGATGNLQTVQELSFQDLSRGGKAMSSEQVFSTTGNSPRRKGTLEKRKENNTLRGQDMEDVRRAVADELNATSGSSITAASPNAPASQQLSGTIGNATQGGLGVLTSSKSRQQFLTTKNVTTDATGEYMQSHPECFVKSKCNSRGEVIKTLRSPMMKTGLRKD